MINPFHGYREEALSILDITLEETIKEFALLDGAFVADRRGRLISAGTYLVPSEEAVVELASGLGARHRAAASITMAARCVSVVVSESTGKVSVYYRGHEFLQLSPVSSQSEGEP